MLSETEGEAASPHCTALRAGRLRSFRLRYSVPSHSAMHKGTGLLAAAVFTDRHALCLVSEPAVVVVHSSISLTFYILESLQL